MSANKFFVRNVKPVQPISFVKEKCTGCNRCVDACPIDIFLPAAQKNETPTVAYPDECWYCGCCVMECPAKAIVFRHPLMNQAHWIEKSSLNKKEEK